MTQAFPLQWPQGRPRSKSPVSATFNKKVREAGKNCDTTKSLTVSDALGRLQREIDLLGAREYVLSSNLQTRLDGLPRSGQSEPDDRGVALYFHLAGKPHCLPCDRYDRVADNIAAIAKHIEATRAIERYGVANLSEMFAGFMALPAPDARRPWREVFAPLPETAPVGRGWIEAKYKILAKSRHPNTPTGSHEKMVELNLAKDEALKEIGQ